MYLTSEQPSQLWVSIIIAACLCAYAEWEVHSCSSITYYGHSYFCSIAFICCR